MPEAACCCCCCWQVGVEDIAVRARVRVTMIPMLNDVPLVGALQVALLEDPLIDFELTVGQGSGGGAGLLDLLEPWLRNFVTDTISSSYVLPGHYFYPLAQVRAPGCQLNGGMLRAVDGKCMLRCKAADADL